MKYFLSGASGIRANVLPRVAALIPHRLLSMHRAFKSNTRYWCEVSNHADSGMKEIMLDSGAYTAYTKGELVTLDELIAVYDDTIRKLNPKLKVWLINLDKIPGERGRLSTPQELSDALIESDKNYKVLRKRYGDRILPVYHQTEGLARLKQIASMTDYIALSFRQDFAEKNRIKYAEEVLDFLAPLGKITHGLATTGYKMLSRAPFDTVDSATWLYIAAMGGIMYINDVGRMMETAVSTSSPRQSDMRSHFTTLTHEEQVLILSRCTDAKVTMKEISTDLSYRILFNAHQMEEWLQHHYKRPVVRAERGLFSL